MATVEVLETSITTLAVDAITNAANTQLQNVGGVALAIVNAGGLDAAGDSTIIQDECDKIMAKRHNKPLGLGEAVATGAGRLPCKWVIHAATMELGGKCDRLGGNRGYDLGCETPPSHAAAPHYCPGSTPPAA